MKHVFLALEELASTDEFSLSIKSKVDLAKQASIWLKDAQYRLYMTAFGAITLAFFAGFVIGWLVFGGK